MIECRGIELYFKEKKIFKDLSFKIEKGSKVCISGPSGKGKTCLLNMLLGIIQPQSGTIIINGKKVNEKNISEIRRLIAWLPQNVNIPVNSGFELSKLLGVKPVNYNNTQNILEGLGLSRSIFYKDFTEISGGEKQRIVIAICINLNKPILIIDEPTSALDNESIGNLISIISKMKDLTVISTSHNAKWVTSCDIVIKL